MEYSFIVIIKIIIISCCCQHFLIIYYMGPWLMSHTKYMKISGLVLRG